MTGGNYRDICRRGKHNSPRKMWRGIFHATSFLSLSKIGKSARKTSLGSPGYRWYNIIKILKNRV
jgi:hypothetical protein